MDGVALTFSTKEGPAISPFGYNGKLQLISEYGELTHLYSLYKQNNLKNPWIETDTNTIHPSVSYEDLHKLQKTHVHFLQDMKHIDRIFNYMRERASTSLESLKSISLTEIPDMKEDTIMRFLIKYRLPYGLNPYRQSNIEETDFSRRLTGVVKYPPSDVY